ncbi:MAG: peptidylprolyl isomerase [Bryobacteraceae bacterium]
MKLVILCCALLTALYAQPAPPPAAPPAEELSPDAVVATYAGKKLTYGELKTFMGVLPPQMQQMAMRDRRAFITQFALLAQLAEMAEKADLAERSPTREALQFQRMYIMANAQINLAMTTITVPEPEVRKFYDVNQGRFSQVRVKVIYVSFSANPPAAAAAGGKQHLDEVAARAKIEKILAEIRKGADFVKMVKQHSEDQTSAAKDGDFGVIRRNDNVPEAIRAAVFALKPGEVSEPVRQPNGFYLFRAEEITTRPFDQVKDEIFNELKQTRFKQWLEETQQGLNLKFENTALLDAPPAAAPARK